MTRWFLIAVALTACAKGKESAPATEAPPPPPPPQAVAADPGTTGSDPNADRKATLEKARNEASLGVSARTDSFEPIEQGEGGKDEKPKTTTLRERKSGGGEQPVIVGSSGTRGDNDKAAYRAVIVDVTVDGKPAPAAFTTAIKTNLAKIQSCYATALAGSPDLIGKLAVTFTVLPTGVLTAGAVGTSTVKQAPLETCVITALAATKLAAPLGKADAKAQVTIQFKAK